MSNLATVDAGLVVCCITEYALRSDGNDVVPARGSRGDASSFGASALYIGSPETAASGCQTQFLSAARAVTHSYTWAAYNTVDPTATSGSIMVQVVAQVVEAPDGDREVMILTAFVHIFY